MANTPHDEIVNEGHVPSVQIASTDTDITILAPSFGESSRSNNGEKEKSAFFRDVNGSSHERYKVILDIRKFEIDLLWKRAAFFWGTIAVLFTLYGVLKREQHVDEHYTWFIAVIGLLFNVIFSLSLRGNKYWQENWEAHARREEQKEDFDLLTTTLNEEIEFNTKDDMFPFRPYRVSISSLVNVLSDITAFAWILVVIFELTTLVKSLHFEFGSNSEIHLLSWAVILFPLLSMSYLGCMLYNQHKKNMRSRRSIAEGS